MLRDVGESFEESAQTKIDEEKKRTGVQVVIGILKQRFLWKIWAGVENYSVRYRIAQ